MRRLYNAFQHAFILAMLIGFIPFSMQGQDDDLAPVTGTYAITNVNIIQSPGSKIEMGTVVLKDGIIKAVGKSVSIPPDARVIKADSMYLYAGFIDGMSHVGVEMPKDEDDNDVDDPGNPPNDIAGIEPYRNVRTFLKPNDKSVEDWRKIGFTAAHVVPDGRMLPGTGAIILLTGDNPDQMVFKNNTSFYSQLRGAPGVYPNTVIGVMAKYRDLYRKAGYAKSYAQRYGSGDSDMKRPKSDRVLEAFYPVIDKKLSVAFKAEDVLDIQRVLKLKNDLGFNLLLGDVKQGWDITDQIKASNAPVFLSLDLPEMEKEKEEPDSVKSEEKEMSEAEKEQERLDQRKKDMIMKYYQQPVVFKSQGITYGFSTLEAKGKDIKANLAHIVKQGLSEDDALAALTTKPAQLLGLSNVMGTVEAGKMANIFISDKPYFDEKSNVKIVFVDGNIYEYEDKPKKEKSGEDIDPTGAWAYTTETPQGTGTGTVTIQGDPGDYSGELTISFSSEPSQLTDIEVYGDELSYSFTINAGGQMLTVDVTVTVDGDTFEGTMTAGQFGSFPVEGERKPE